MTPILRLLRAAAGSDRDLLDRYARDRDEPAFAELVRRYGRSVWAACVRLAPRDAEDAFQAVFLTLSRKAGTVTGSLPAWLHAVARRVTSNLRRDARRRTAAESGAARLDAAPATDPGLREGLALLDEELAGLPERYRAVLIVCCLEGRSRDEAAAQLGWSEGQVKGRLERARETLRTRLARRGVELGGVLLAIAVCRPAPALSGTPSPTVLSLANGVAHAMTLQKLKVLVAVLALAVGAVAYYAPHGGASATADPPAKSGPQPTTRPTPEQPAEPDGSDILRACLAKSDLVVLGEFTDEPVGESTEAGVVHYRCDVKVAEVIKGAKTAGDTLKLHMVRLESVAADRLPELRKGGRCILFLKPGGAGDPAFTPADYWFGVQRPSPAMARELRRLAARKKPGEPAVASASDARRLEGVWRVAKEEQPDGRREKWVEARRRDAAFTFTDGHVTLTNLGNYPGYRLTIDEGEKTLLLQSDNLDGLVLIRHGRYRFDGDRLTVCLGEKRPEDFSPKDPAARLYHLERADVDIRDADGRVLVSADEIAAYDWATHTLDLKPGSVAKLRKALADSKQLAVPFAVAVGGRTVYRGEITTPLSSRSCSGVVVVPAVPPDGTKEGERIRLQLGYPTENFFKGQDPRGDADVKAVLKVSGKLK